MIRCCLAALILLLGSVRAWAGPDCSRTYTLGLHEHGLLYASESDSGIDRDFADELIRRSGCKVALSVLPRARIWQLIESGALDFSLSGITNAEREKFAVFAWYTSNKYYLLVRQDSGVKTQDDFVGKDSLRIGIIRSFRYSPAGNQLVDRLLAANRVSQSAGLAPLYEALALNQIQGMIIEPFDYPALDEKKIRDFTRIIEFNDPPVLHGVIMSKKALSEVEQNEWRALVNAMRADGTVRRIFEKYFPADLAAAMTDFVD